MAVRGGLRGLPGACEAQSAGVFCYLLGEAVVVWSVSRPREPFQIVACFRGSCLFLAIGLFPIVLIRVI